MTELPVWKYLVVGLLVFFLVTLGRNGFGEASEQGAPSPGGRSSFICAPTFESSEVREKLALFTDTCQKIKVASNYAFDFDLTREK